MMGSIKYILPLFFLLTYLNSFGQIGVMTYNIRYDNPNDGENWWDKRKADVVDLLKYYNPEFVGIQEGMNNQITYLDEQLENYAYFGFGRDGKGSSSEAVPIFYDSTQFELINGKVFWLSETPEVISKGWDAALNRIVTYGAFRNKQQGDTLHLFNCHFDHIGKEARLNSAKVILNKIKELNLIDKKIIVMGDMNCLPEDAPYQVLNETLEDAMQISEQAFYGPDGTWNGFDTELVMSRRIDYIFSKNLKILNYRHIDDRRKNNLHVSDHLPVMINLKY